MTIEHAWDQVGCLIDELDTPALLVDLDMLKCNIGRMAAFGTANGVAVRPHAKAHKSPLIAHMQLVAGAVGVCCQKVGEAEVLAGSGVGDILISNEVVGRAKVARLTALAQRTHLTVAVDAEPAAQAISSAAAAGGTIVGVVIDVDVGQERCGVSPGAPAVALAKSVQRMPGLELRGLQGYQGKLQHVAGYAAREAAARDANSRLIETRQEFERNGLPTEIVTGGGTGTYETESAAGGLTEIQPGSYVFMDRQYREIGGRAGAVYDDFEVALTVSATVMSVPTADRVVVDAGLKALSNDVGPAELLDIEGWEYVPAGDEHGLLLRRAEGPQPKLGNTVRLLPSHCDTTVNLYDRYHVVRDGRLEGVWSIAARGRIR